MKKAKYRIGQRVLAYIYAEWRPGIIKSLTKQYGFTKHGDRWEYCITLDKAFSVLPILPEKDEYLVAETNMLRLI